MDVFLEMTSRVTFSSFLGPCARPTVRRFRARSSISDNRMPKASTRISTFPRSRRRSICAAS